MKMPLKGPIYYFFPKNPFGRKSHFDILCWFNTLLFRRGIGFCFPHSSVPGLSGAPWPRTPVCCHEDAPLESPRWPRLQRTGKGCPRDEAAREMLGYLSKQLANRPRDYPWHQKKSSEPSTNRAMKHSFQPQQRNMVLTALKWIGILKHSWTWIYLRLCLVAGNCSDGLTAFHNCMRCKTKTQGSGSELHSN